MLGFSIRVVHAGQQLSVIIPAQLFIVLLLLVPLPFLISAFRGTTTARGRRNVLLMIGFDLFFLSAAFTPAKIVLDAKHGTADVSTMMFFIPHHRTLTLSQVQGSMVKTSEVTDALVLVMSDGHAVQLTPFNQVSGTDEAVAAINQFLRAHGGEGSPY